MCELRDHYGHDLWVCDDGSCYQPDYGMSFESVKAWEVFFEGRALRHAMDEYTDSLDPRFRRRGR